MEEIIRGYLRGSTRRAIREYLNPPRGFLRTDDPNIPEDVRKAARSVVRIYSFAGVRRVRRSDVVAAVEENRRLPDYAQIMRDGGRERDLIAISEHILANCPESQATCIGPDMRRGYGQGSGFVLGADNRLWTSMHNFEELVDVRTGRIPTGRPLAAFGVSEDGKVVFDPIANPPRVQTSGTRPREARGRSSKDLADLAELFADFVEIETPRRIAEPLRVASDTSPMERLYSVGYAACTGCGFDRRRTLTTLRNSDFSRRPAPDADGQSLVVTIGNLADSTGSEQSTAIYRIGDARQGMSGGPTLNKRGEVVGITNAVMNGPQYSYEGLDYSAESFVTRPSSWNGGRKSTN